MGLRWFAVAVCLVACSSTAVIVEQDDAGAPLDAATAPDSATDGGPPVTMDGCAPVPETTVTTASTDCRRTGVCSNGCADGVRYTCTGAGVPTSAVLGFRLLGCSDAPGGGFCCPASCVRRSSQDGACGGGRVLFDCAPGSTAQPTGCTPNAVDGGGGTLCCDP